MVATYFEVGVVAGYLLALSVALGAAPASYLGAGVPVRARWALAPGLGLAVLICLYTTVGFVIPGRDSAWLLVPLVPAFVVWAWFRRGELRAPWSWRSAVELASIALAVFVVFSYPLGAQRSVGPGGFQVYDGPNYTAVELGLQRNAVFDEDWGPIWDLTAADGKYFGHSGVQQIGFQATAAAIDSAIGVEPVRTQIPYMITIVLIGALAMFGLLTTLVPGWRPTAWLGALLYAGPVLFQLVLDGSESALVGMAMMSTAVATGSLVLRPGRRRSHLVLFALAASALQAAYPIFAPGLAAAVGLLVVGFVLWQWKTKPDDRVSIPRVVAAVLAAFALVVAFAPLSFIRSLAYWKDLLEGAGVVPGLPTFDLPLPVIPGWLFGTREFYNLNHLSDVNVTQWLLTDVIPLTFLVLVVLAVFARRSLLPLIVLAAVTLLVVLGITGSGCSYCVQRGLLPMGPMLGAFLAAGIGVVAALRFRGAAWIAAGGLVATLVVVWHMNGVLAVRGARGAYLTPKVVLDLADAAARQPGPLLVEGWGQAWDGPAELPTVLHAASGGSSTRISLSTETNDFNGLAYIGGPKPSGPVFVPDYRTVLTRFGSVENDRVVIKRVGSIAIQRRVKPFDVTSISGTIVNRVGQNPPMVFVANPMGFIVVGPKGPPPALQVEIHGIRRDQFGKLDPGTRLTRVRRGYRVCIPMRGKGVIRRPTIRVNPPLVSFAAPRWWANKPVVAGGPVLISMHVVPSCP